MFSLQPSVQCGSYFVRHHTAKLKRTLGETLFKHTYGTFYRNTSLPHRGNQKKVGNAAYRTSLGKRIILISLTDYLQCKTIYFIGAYSDLTLVIRSSFIVSFFCYFYLLIVISHARVHIACINRFVQCLSYS